VSYRVRRLKFTIPWALASFAAILYFMWRVVRPPALFVVAFLVIAVVNAWSLTLVFSVDRRGIRFARRSNDRSTPLVPWSSIREVVVWNAGPAGLGASGEPEVGVRLRPDAPLPRGVPAIIHDPSDPDAVAPELRTAIPGLDRARLEAAVQAHGGGVTVVNG
jgi:hypothetical protein